MFLFKFISWLIYGEDYNKIIDRHNVSKSLKRRRRR